MFFRNILFLSLLLFFSVKAFDDVKNGWYINPNIGLESVYLKEKLYDATQGKTISKDTTVSALNLNAEFGYIFKDGFLIGAGIYGSSLGNKPELLTNKKGNKYFDIVESGTYLVIGLNFKEKHFIRLYGNSSVITGDDKFIKDSEEFDGDGFILKYSYEPFNHFLISPFLRSSYLINENEWSNKIILSSFGIEIGWIFY